MPLDRVDETYEAKMAEFEAECNGGKGDAQACHNVAEFYTVVKDNFEKAAKVYSANCSDKKYMPSCFSLGRFHCKNRLLFYMFKCINLLWTCYCSGW